jgi:hypothetical protein
LLGCLPSTAGLSLLKEFEDSLARCTSLYTDDQLGRLAPQLVRCWGRLPPLAAPQKGGG